MKKRSQLSSETIRSALEFGSILYCDSSPLETKASLTGIFYLAEYTIYQKWMCIPGLS